MRNQRYSGHSLDEFRLMVQAVSFLALLTGLLYLRAMLAGGVVLQPGGMQAAVTLVGVLGLLAAWRWPVPGAVVAVGAGLLLGWLVYTTDGGYPLVKSFSYASPFVLTGALYLVWWWRRLRKIRE
jgi:hypothetical protein